MKSPSKLIDNQEREREKVLDKKSLDILILVQKFLGKDLVFHPILFKKNPN